MRSNKLCTESQSVVMGHDGVPVRIDVTNPAPPNMFPCNRPLLGKEAVLLLFLYSLPHIYYIFMLALLNSSLYCLYFPSKLLPLSYQLPKTVHHRVKKWYSKCIWKSSVLSFVFTLFIFNKK